MILSRSSDLQLKPIETRYKGYRFRSRLEARWAVFFDALGIEWEYEPEGFDLGDGVYYLPDFWLPQVYMWAEVKADTIAGDDLEKCKLLVRQSGYSLLRLEGIPENKPYFAIEWWIDSNGIGDWMMEFSFCLTMYHNYPIDENRFYCSCDADDEFRDTQEAVYAARSARFEHGESP